ncbi:class I SAM-dependent methyltransferase [Pseudomonadota bacterium]
MAGYHKFVFDTERRRLVGAFEEMYQAEDQEGFDSWHSNDTRALRLRLALEILKDYNFDEVLELGCGKGVASQFLKKKNNRVVGIDISETAIRKASGSFPDIEFIQMSADDVAQLATSFDLITIMTVLAYIENWRELLQQVSKMTSYCLVAEYIPENPIGMVKSVSELEEAFMSSFDVVTKLVLDDNCCIFLGKSKA